MSAYHEDRERGCTCVWESSDSISYPDDMCKVHGRDARRHQRRIQLKAQIARLQLELDALGDA